MTMATMNVLMTIDHGGSDDPDDPDDHNSKLSGVIKASQ